MGKWGGEGAGSQCKYIFITSRLLFTICNKNGPALVRAKGTNLLPPMLMAGTGNGNSLVLASFYFFALRKDFEDRFRLR